MGDVLTEAEIVESVKTFHELLRRFIAAKIPICLAFGTGCSSVHAMNLISDRFESHVVNHGTIESYLSDKQLPNAYRVALEQWLLGAHAEALDRLASGAEGQRYFKNAVGFVLLQASLILGFLFFGMVAICLWLLPKMEALQSESFTKPGVGLILLAALAKTLPYWSFLIIAFAIVSFLFRRALSEQVLARVTPMREESYALSEFQSLFSRPARFQWMVSCVVVLCGFFVLLQALSVVGVTLELLTQLVTS
jgi:hypothetical protein